MLTFILRGDLMASSGLDGRQYFDLDLERRGSPNNVVGLTIFRILTSIMDVEVDKPSSTRF